MLMHESLREDGRFGELGESAKVEVRIHGGTEGKTDVILDQKGSHKSDMEFDL